MHRKAPTSEAVLVQGDEVRNIDKIMGAKYPSICS
jgi:hypothetical protein